MDIWVALGITAGVVLGAIGLWCLRGGKRVLQDDGAAEGLSGPTRLTLGISCVLVGYHCVMWVVPAVSFGVPVDRWWIVAAGAVLAVVGALAVDLVESNG